MATPSAHSPLAHSSAAPTHPQFDGARLSPTTLLLIACGVFGGGVFAMVYLIEGASRPGYIAWQQAISALSLGPGGWMQQLNFLVFGALTLASAFGWRMALKPGAGATWYPIIKGVIGVGLIVDGVFSQDPAIGYPVGAVVGAPTLHGVIHSLVAIVTITAIAISCFVLARRFAIESRWRGWALWTALTGLLTIVLITIFGAMSGHIGTPAGLFERLATGVNTMLSLAIFGRLLRDRRRYTRQ